MDAILLESARRKLKPYLPDPNGPEAVIFGVRLSLLGREELLAVLNFQAAMHKVERNRLIAERDSLLTQHRPSLLRRALGLAPRPGPVAKS